MRPVSQRTGSAVLTHLLALALTLILTAFSSPTAASGSIHSTALRAQLLDIVRPRGSTLVVKQILSDGESAYVCAIATLKKGGGLRELVPGGGLEIREWLLLKEPATMRWLKFEWTVSALADTAGGPPCYSGEKFKNLSVALDELRFAVVLLLRQNATNIDVDIPQIISSDPPAEEMYKELSRRGLADSDFEVDNGNDREWGPSDVEGAELRCHTAACRGNLKHSVEILRGLESSTLISPIVWNGCVALLRGSPTMPVGDCLHLASLDVACARGAFYFRDRNRIQACKAAIRRSCERASSTVPSALACKTAAESHASSSKPKNHAR